MPKETPSRPEEQDQPIFKDPRWVAIQMAMQAPDQAHHPLHRRLYILLRHALLDGRFVAGETFPASRTVARALGLSRNTVLTALDQLTAEGYIASRQGAGTTVCADIADFALSTDSGLPQPEAPGQGVQRRRPSRLAERLCQQFDHGPPLMRSPLQSPPRPFRPGIPALDAFPWTLWSRALGRRWRQPSLALTSGVDVAGYPPLRHAIADYLRTTRAVSCTADQILVVNGAQQALDLAVRLLVDRGGEVLVETPGFSGVGGVLQAAGATVVRVPVDDQGACLPPSEELSGGVPGGNGGTEESGQVALLTPSRSYPLGVTMSLSRRLAWLHWARQQTAQGRRAWIIEDDFDSDFRFDGAPLASLHGLDSQQQVLYTGTFTRALFPSIRLGYLVVPLDLIEPARMVRRMMDGGGSAVIQAALADFIEDGHFAAHVRAMRRLYGARRKILTEWLNDDLSNYLKMIPSDGGLHITTELPKGVNDCELVSKLRRCNIEAVALSPYYQTNAAVSGLILGFAAWPEDQLHAACADLCVSLSPSCERNA